MRRTLTLALIVLFPAAAVAEGLRPVARPAERGAAEMAALAPPIAPPAVPGGETGAATGAATGTETGPGSGAAPTGPAGPEVGPETGLPLPRYVSLKADEANARRGPGGDHRIDWVFVRRAMPLRVTAEYGNWRRIEDAEGEGGWVHYALLSGTRTVLVRDEVSLRRRPDEGAYEIARVAAGVIAALEECADGWCRVAVGDHEGWVRDAELWGVDPGEDVAP